jgi:hypothetical protein
MKVNNINGTSQSTCKCGSWLDHWRKFSGQALPSTCSELSCVNKPDLGAHVQRDNTTDRSWYIVPLCKSHNSQIGRSINILDSTRLASANVATTCGR